MGHGAYSSSDRMVRATSLGYYTKGAGEIFSQRNINNAMSPHGVTLRESRDSAEHPKSLAIIIALDVTGSMGSVPHFLVKNGLPNIMARIIAGGVPDPQVLFLAIGDHEVDAAPLQVGQFESGDELLDKWLTTVWLEGGGGGNAGESYMLAWYFAAFCTEIDCLEKRDKKGILITIGDEPVLDAIPAPVLKGIMGDGQYENYSALQLYGKAMEKYDVYHIHIRETGSGARQHVMDGWKQIAQDNLLIAQRHEIVSDLIADVVLRREGGPAAELEQEAPALGAEGSPPEEEIIL